MEIIQIDSRIKKHTQFHYSIAGKFYRVNFFPSINKFYITCKECNKKRMNCIKIIY